MPPHLLTQTIGLFTLMLRERAAYVELLIGALEARERR